MKLKPLTQWICDECGEIIEKPEVGYVVWRYTKDYKTFGYKVIHQGKCDKDKLYSGSMGVPSFLGASGREYLLYFLSIGRIKVLQGHGPTTIGPKDIDEFVDLFRRMQTPYYEEARTRFSERSVLEEHYDSNEVSPYLEDSLKAIIGME